MSAVGAYAIQNNPIHIYWALVFGVAGYFLKKYGYQMGPIILGVILGPMIDANYRRAMIGARSDPIQFLVDLSTNPISLVLSTALLVLLLSQAGMTRWVRRAVPLQKE